MTDLSAKSSTTLDVPKKKPQPPYLKYSMDPLSLGICINAVSGQKYYDSKTTLPIYNNSLASLQLYCVSDCSGKADNVDPRKLYYDTPDQYERHRNIKLPSGKKDEWRARMVKLGFDDFRGATSSTTSIPQESLDDNELIG